MNLYRNNETGKVGGVCAGLADHLNIDPLVVRILFVMGFFMTGGALFWAYIIAWIALAPGKPEVHADSVQYDETVGEYRKRNLFSYRDSSSVRIRRAKERLRKVMTRIEDMECYVTSKKYGLNKEFADLDKENR